MFDPETPKPLYRRGSSGGALRNDQDGRKSPEAIVSPRSLDEVTRQPPTATEFGIDLITNLPVLMHLLEEVLDSNDTTDEEKVGLTVTLVEMLKMHDFVVKCVSYMANKECKSCQDPNTLFRQTTPLVLICRALCTSFGALKFLRPLVSQAYGILLRDDDHGKPVTGAVLDELLIGLSAALSQCPMLLRLFFQRVYSIVNVRHDGYGSMALANFFFLRFLLPALVTPGDLLQQHVLLEPDQRRRIMEAVKALHWLANGVVPQENEDMRDYVQAKQEAGWTNRFFIELITSRPDDAVSEVGNTMEFTASDFNPLRHSLFGWIWRHLDGWRERLGPQLQLHSWLADNEAVRKAMVTEVHLGRESSGMLSPPRRSPSSAAGAPLKSYSSSSGLRRQESNGGISK